MFYDGSNAFKILNSIASKDAPAGQRDQPRGKWYSGTARGTPWTLFFGAMAGAAVGVLHLVALANDWKLEDAFELLDAPVAGWFHRSFLLRFDFPQWLGPIRSYLAWPIIHLYWILIGLFVTSLICLAHHRLGRRALLSGACGGIFVGCLNLLALVKGWFTLSLWFGFLDQPARTLEEAVRVQIEDSRSAESFRLYRTLSTTGAPYWRLTYLVYWFAVGLLLALLFCVVWMLVRRKAARENQMSEE